MSASVVSLPWILKSPPVMTGHNWTTSSSSTDDSLLWNVSSGGLESGRRVVDHSWSTTTWSDSHVKTDNWQ